MHQDFQWKHSESEVENEDVIKTLELEIQRKKEGIYNLQKEDCEI